jgi:hypothetical protein
VESGPGKGTRVAVRLPAQFVTPIIREAGRKFCSAPATESQIQRQGKQL